MHEYVLRGVRVQFPYDAYDVQVTPSCKAVVVFCLAGFSGSLHHRSRHAATGLPVMRHAGHIQHVHATSHSLVRGPCGVGPQRAVARRSVSPTCQQHAPPCVQRAYMESVIQALQEVRRPASRSVAVLCAALQYTEAAAVACRKCMTFFH